MYAENQVQLFEKMDVLRTVPVFKDLDEACLSKLASVCTLREFPPGAVIIKQSQDVEDLYVIVSGNVKLIRYAHASGYATDWRGQGGALQVTPSMEGAGGGAAGHCQGSRSCMRLHAGRGRHPCVWPLYRWHQHGRHG